VIGLYYNIGNLIFAPLWNTVIQREKAPAYCLKLFLMIYATAVLYFILQSTFNYSMKYITAAISGSIIYIAIPLSYWFDFIFFGNQFGVLELIGVILIVGVNVILGLLKGKGLV
jgi:drug/metabolite transporter (DMT)-like permease